MKWFLSYKFVIIWDNFYNFKQLSQLKPKFYTKSLKQGIHLE